MKNVKASGWDDSPDPKRKGMASMWDDGSPGLPQSSISTSKQGWDLSPYPDQKQQATQPMAKPKKEKQKDPDDFDNFLDDCGIESFN